MCNVGDCAAASPTCIVVGREVWIHQIAGYVGTILRGEDCLVDGCSNLIAKSLQLLVGHAACIEVVIQIHLVVSQRLAGQFVIILISGNRLGLQAEILIFLPKRDVQFDGSGSFLGSSNGSLDGILTCCGGQGLLSGQVCIHQRLGVNGVFVEIAVVGQCGTDRLGRQLVGIAAIAVIGQ